MMALLVGCSGSGSDGPVRLAPADGQSNVSAYQPLMLLDVDFPEDAPVPAVITVVDLTNGGFVDGVVQQLPGGIGFVAEELWPPGHSFLWTIEAPLSEVRQPSIDLPASVLGSMVFHTDNRLVVLAASVVETGEICLITSRPLLLSEVSRLTLSIDDEPTSLISSRLLESAQLESGTLPDDDDGLGGVCVVVGGFEPAVGSMLRARVGSESIQTPLTGSSTQELVSAIRKETSP